MLGVGLGVDGGWMPLPTRPQRYCDPASLVDVIKILSCYQIYRHLKKTINFEQVMPRNELSYQPKTGRD